MSLPFILYAIYPFLKSGVVFVNSADGNIYIGNGENAPVKLITELNIGDYETGGGGDEPSTNPNWPALEDLTLGNTINWAGHEWIVCDVIAKEACLALNGSAGKSTWYNLRSACTNFANKLTTEQKACLKSVTTPATSGVVFVATFDQADGGFAYFTSDSRRNIGVEWWLSSEVGSSGSSHGSYIQEDGSLSDDTNKSSSLAFRPFVCIDLTKYTVS